MEMDYYQFEEEELEEKIKVLKEEIELKKQQKGAGQEEESKQSFYTDFNNKLNLPNDPSPPKKRSNSKGKKIESTAAKKNKSGTSSKSGAGTKKKTSS